MSDSDKQFAGSIPKIYESLLVPLIFNSYADDLLERLQRYAPASILEVAAGTGVVTRRLATALGPGTRIVATDLNQAMPDEAVLRGTGQPVEWRQADAMELPFEDGEFDAVVCQFGAMFFPDKGKAYFEARRVLKPGGLFLFSVWDRIADNEFADEINSAMGTLFPNDPPQFLSRTPYGYYDPEILRRDLAAGGFRASPRISTVSARSRAVSPQIPAVAYCEGTPLRGEIEARSATGLADATDFAARTLERRFGSGPVDGKIQALVAEVRS